LGLGIAITAIKVGALSILELGPLKDHEFNHFRMLVEESEVGTHAVLELVERIVFQCGSGFDGSPESIEGPTDAGDVQISLCWEVAEDRPLCDAQPVSKSLCVGGSIAMLGEELGGGVKNVATATLLKRRIRGTS